MRAPAVKSKVTMLPRARSSCSGERLPVTALDQLSGPEEEVSSPGAGHHWVLQSPSKRSPADSIWKPTRWLKGCVKCLTNEDVPCWELVTPMTNEGTRGTKELAKQLLATWQWTFMAGTTDFCLPSPSMLNIDQFLDEAADVKDAWPGCWPMCEPYNTWGKPQRGEGGTPMRCISPCKCHHWWTRL